MKVEELFSAASSFRLGVLDMIERAGAGEVATSFAAIELLMALYLGEDNGRRILSFDPAKPKAADRDYVVISDVALTPAWYFCLAKAGFFDSHELQFFGKARALLTLNPTIKIPGVDVNVRAPGVGLAIGEGMARGLALSKKNNRVFVILTDEDLRLGLPWESMMNVTNDRLTNLVLICVYSRSQRLSPLQDKLKAFGWEVLPLVNGHDVAMLLPTLARAKESTRRPACVLVPTVLAKGVPFAEGKIVYRGTLFSPEELREARSHLTSKTA